MRRKIFFTVGILTVMAIVLSVTAFAAEGDVAMTDYGIVTVLFEKLTINIKAFFNVIDSIYLFFKNLFG